VWLLTGSNIAGRYAEDAGLPFEFAPFLRQGKPALLATADAKGRTFKP
jgi:hypothetical protein